MLYLVKLGGSLITDKTKPYKARKRVIKRLAREIAEARRERKFKLVLGNGGGSFPHTSAKRYKTAEGIINEQSIKGIAIVHRDAAILNQMIVEALLEAGENAISIQPSAILIAKDKRTKLFHVDAILRALKYGMLPVVYGDVIFDDKRGCCIYSTEKILCELAKIFRRRSKERITIISCGITDGVYANGKVVKVINRENIEEIKKYLGSSHGVDVTGGMLHKVMTFYELARKFKIESLIINGNVPNNLKKALIGERVKGTLITA